MLRRFLSLVAPGARPPGTTARPRLPEGRRVYAIGDIHGCADLLRDLLARIREDAAAAPAGTAFSLVFLGDYVDRGLQSREVLDLLVGDPWPEAAKVYLRGNHDEMMRRFLTAPRHGQVWFDIGGAATLYSYRVGLGAAPAGDADPADWAAVADRLAAALPPAHRRFLDATVLSHRAGDYLFVHAGVRPGVPLDRQDPEDLMTIREPFLSEAGGTDYVVVHGHTPVPHPVVERGRIAIDTGAYASGRLTALVLQDDGQRFLHT